MANHPEKYHSSLRSDVANIPKNTPADYFLGRQIPPELTPSIFPDERPNISGNFHRRQSACSTTTHHDPASSTMTGQVTVSQVDRRPGRRRAEQDHDPRLCEMPRKVGFGSCSGRGALPPFPPEGSKRSRRGKG